MITQFRAFLIPALFAALMTSCGSTEADAERSGQDLYARYGCSSCHGATGAGGPLGPPLRGMADFWEQEALTKFLVDPTESFAKDERLAQLRQAFGGKMRAFSELSEQQLARIADFVLSL